MRSVITFGPLYSLPSGQWFLVLGFCLLVLENSQQTTDIIQTVPARPSPRSSTQPIWERIAPQIPSSDSASQRRLRSSFVLNLAWQFRPLLQAFVIRASVDDPS